MAPAVVLGVVLVVVLGVAACSAPPPPPAAVPGAALALDPDATEVLVRAWRDGPLAAAGHNHVISARAFEGRVTPVAGGEYAFDLRLPVVTLVVDDPDARARAGDDFAAPVDAAARDGTRGNLLGPRLLDAGRFAAIGLAGRTVTGPDGARSLDVAITVRELTRSFRIPVDIVDGPAGPRVRGELRVRHADLGLEPFSVMGGMLRVRDELVITFAAGLASGGAGGVSAAAGVAPAAGR